MKAIKTLVALLLLSIASQAKEHKTTLNTEEKPLAIVIPSYNNKHFYKRNLKTVFMQNYENYRIIYINDASTDGTGNLAQAYIKECKQEHRTTFINNKTNRGALANTYKAIHLCDDHEIIIILDGDDWCAHDKVFEKINKAYQDKNIWTTYGQYEEIHYNQKKDTFFKRPGICKQIPPNIVRAHAYREDGWVSSHVKTFYAGLFKNIKLQDLLDKDGFLTAACDMAYMFPILEMVAGKFKFIKDTLYIYNCIPFNNVYKTKLQKQLHNANILRAKNKYMPLETPYKHTEPNNQTDLIILSEGNMYKLYTSLESVTAYMPGLQDIYILYSPENDPKSNFDMLKQIYKNIHFVEILDTNTFKKKLEDTIITSKSPYILFSTDTTIVQTPVDIQYCITLMEQTYAYGFFLYLGKNTKENHALIRKQKIAPHVEISKNIYAWQFKYGEHNWRRPHNLFMTLYRKNDILQSVRDLNYNSSENLSATWNNQLFDMENIGLFFEASKVKNV